METPIIDNIAFDRSKIYEKMLYKPQPEGYSMPLSWMVQQHVAATNGVHYIDRIGKLKEYPVFELPLNKVEKGIMLDIGNGWGRWLVAGASKGYIPIGIDIRLEFCQTARQTLKNLNKKGYSLVADLNNLPFHSNVFDLVWSYSVIQHTHKQRLEKCLGHINRILKKDGYSCLEFPNKLGIRNRFGPVKEAQKTADDINSWDVRYYTIGEYKEIFKKHFSDFKFRNHSFLGIGVLKEDLKYVSFKNKILCSISLFGSFLTKIIPGLKYLSDSIYISVDKKQDADVKEENNGVAEFLKAHSAFPDNNLNLVHILRCPISGGSLKLDSVNNRLISEKANVAFPIENDIPIMIVSEAIPL